METPNHFSQRAKQVCVNVRSSNFSNCWVIHTQFILRPCAWVKNTMSRKGRRPQPLLMMCFAVWTIRNTK